MRVTAGMTAYAGLSLKGGEDGRYEGFRWSCRDTTRTRQARMWIRSVHPGIWVGGSVRAGVNLAPQPDLG